MVIGLLLKELSGTFKEQHLMVSTSLVGPLFPYMVLQMLIGLVVLMTENPPVATWYISIAPLFLGYFLKIWKTTHNGSFID